MQVLLCAVFLDSLLKPHKLASSGRLVSRDGVMAEAIWNGVIIAKTPAFESVEGNVYFPPQSISMEYFKPSKYA